MANGFQGAPAVDFYSMLSGLGDTIAKNRNDSAKKDAYAAAMTPGPDGKVDFGKAIMGLAQVDPHAASVLSSVQAHQDSVKSSDRNYDLALQARKDAQSNAARAQSNADREWNYDPTEERTDQAKANGIDPNSPVGKSFILTGKLPDNFVPGGAKFGLSPVYGTKTGQDGKPIPSMVQLGQDGTVNEPKLPEGFNIARDPIKIDNGTSWTLLDPQTRQIVGTQPKDIAGAEAAKEEGSAQGLAKVALPQALATANQTLKTIEELKAHPGLDHSVGLWSAVPNIPGSAGSDFNAKANQLKGQTFLQAYQTLRGSGAITDIEGKKGEDAIAALDRAQSKTQYVAALNDLKTVIMGGMLRAKAKAAGDTSPAMGGDGAPGAPVTIDGYTIRAH